MFLFRWEKTFGAEKTFGVPSSCSEAPQGYLVDIINEFAKHGGFEHVSEHFKNPLLDAQVGPFQNCHTFCWFLKNTFFLQDMYYLLLPFCECGEFLNTEVVQPYLEPCIVAAVNYVKNLSDADLRHPVR